MRKIKKSQIGIEYLLIVGFVTFAIIVVLGLALAYSGSIRDEMRMSHVNNFANKIIAASESVYYSGTPAKSTISVYLPEGVASVEINEDEDMMVVEVQSSTGLNRIAFQSKVSLLQGADLTASSGSKKIEITASNEGAVINQIS